MDEEFIKKMYEGPQPLHNPFSDEMGALIRKAREKAGLSQTDLAKRIHRRRASITNIENGKMEPDASTLMMIAIHLNVSIARLFPDPFGSLLGEHTLSKKEEELLLLANRLVFSDLFRLIEIAKTFIDLEETEQENPSFYEDYAD